MTAGLTSGINLSADGGGFLDFGVSFGEGANASLLGVQGGQFTLATLAEHGLDNLISAGASSLVYDTDFADSFLRAMGSSVASLASADLQSQIGDLFADGQNGGEGSIGHILAHAGVGCGAAVLSGASCGAGAAGGVAQSLYAGTDPATRLTPEQVERTARLIGAAVGYVASEGQGENVSIAASVAASGARNNYLWHYQADMLERAKADLAECQSKDNCSQKRLDFLKSRVAYFQAVDEFTDAELKRACGANPTGSECQAVVSDALCAGQSLTGSACGGSPFGAPRWGYKSPSEVLKLTRFEAGKARPGDALAHNIDQHHEHVSELLAKYPEAVEHARQTLAVSTALELVVGGVGAKAGARALGRYGLTTWPKGVAGTYGERLYQISRLDLDRAVGQAGGATNRTVDDIWGGNRTVVENVTTRGTSIERVPGGTRAQADADFDALGLTNVRNIGTDRRMGTLPDGTNVIVRPSRDGRPTIEFQRVTENGNTRTTREIRYGD